MESGTKLVIPPINQRFSKPPKTCDIYFFKRKTRSHSAAMIRLISILNPFWIFVWNNNSGGWILLHGFALFICQKPHFLGLWFDIVCKNPIGCMYPFRRWNGFRKGLALLTIPHVFRYIGLSFLITGVTTSPLDSRFAAPAAYGDLIAAVLALAAVMALLFKSRYSVSFVWIFVEEKALRKSLPGYAEYMVKIRYRLIPFVW